MAIKNVDQCNKEAGMKMTNAEAIAILSKYAKSEGDDFMARPHMAKACQMAIRALREQEEKEYVSVPVYVKYSKSPRDVSKRAEKKDDSVTQLTCRKKDLKKYFYYNELKYKYKSFEEWLEKCTAEDTIFLALFLTTVFCLDDSATIRSGTIIEP